jgi:hypothetical protein
VFFAACGALMIQFFAYHQHKIDSGLGVKFYDGVMNMFPRADVSVFIFSITYGALALYLVLFARKIEYFSALAFTFGTVQVTRILTMTLLPLDVPPNIVFLEDPFLNELIYPGNVDADLFYSGHTAFVFGMFFLSKKYIFLALGIVLGCLLMVQRVHYSIDILAAIPITFGITRLVGRLLPSFED